MLAVLAGGVCGLAAGAAFVFCLALMTGAFDSELGWFVVVHAAFAMMLMGGWTAPCFVQEKIKPDARSSTTIVTEDRDE